jgi:hypothetical protein
MALNSALSKAAGLMWYSQVSNWPMMLLPSPIAFGSQSALDFFFLSLKGNLKDGGDSGSSCHKLETTRTQEGVKRGGPFQGCTKAADEGIQSKVQEYKSTRKQNTNHKNAEQLETGLKLPLGKTKTQ